MLQGLTTKQRLYIMAMYQMDARHIHYWKFRSMYRVKAIAMAAGEGNLQNGYNVMTGLKKSAAIKKHRFEGRVYYSLTQQAYDALDDMVRVAAEKAIVLTDYMFEGAL